MLVVLLRPGQAMHRCHQLGAPRPSIGGPVLGGLGAFDEHTDDCTHYAKHWTFYFAASSIRDDNQKRAIFLPAVSAK